MIKKGQSGSGASVLIAVITLLFVFYILFLPSEERALLLGDENETTSTKRTALEENFLVKEKIGTLTGTTAIEEEHSIPTAYLREVKNAKTLVDLNPFKVSRSIITDNSKQVRFNLNNVENAEDVILTFEPVTMRGTLKMQLNGALIFEGDVKSPNPAPIKISKSLLREENVLEISVNSVGIAFWKTNEYGFTGLRIIGNVLDEAQKSAENQFTLTKEEYERLEKANFEFYASCNQEAVGTLHIFVNDKRIYTSVPECDFRNKQEIDKKDLQEGKNTISFALSSGSTSLENLKIKTQLTPGETHTTFFTVDELLFEEITYDVRDVTLEIDFTEKIRDKIGEIDINGIATTLDQKEDKLRIKLNPYIKEGNNFIEIIPETNLYILELRVVVEK